MSARLRPLLLLLAVGVAAAQNWQLATRARCWTSGNGRPAQWWNDGERIDRGKYWYVCERGELSPRGCFSDDNTRLSIGGNYVADGYEISCVLDPQGYLTFQTTACVTANGTRQKSGEQWTDPSNLYYFECLPDGPYLKAAVVGCLSHDKSRRIPLGERYDYGDYSYECQKKYNGSIQMCSVGCVHNGQHFNVGQQWPDKDYLFYCKLNGGRCQKICVGCLFRQKRLYDGDRYRHDGTVFQCEVRPDAYGRRAVGCVSEDSDGSAIDRVVGCRWYLDRKESRIEQTCEMRGERAAVQTVSCVLRYKGFDTLQLEPNTYTIWNPPGGGLPIGVTCKTTEEGAVLEKFNVDEMYKYVQGGLKYEAPRG